jgi:hypothetical protein
MLPEVQPKDKLEDQLEARGRIRQEKHLHSREFSSSGYRWICAHLIRLCGKLVICGAFIPCESIASVG